MFMLVFVKDDMPAIEISELNWIELSVNGRKAETSLEPGADPREARGRSPPRRLMVKKIETPGQSKVGFSSPRMPQNSPFWAQKSKNFLGRGHPLPTSDFPRRIRRLDPRAYGARLDVTSAPMAPRPQAPPFDPLATPQDPPLLRA